MTYKETQKHTKKKKIQKNPAKCKERKTTQRKDGVEIERKNYKLSLIMQLKEINQNI